ncbi:hypothetical protein FNB15_03590 [Ferrovibrio terrae]|uniref:Uncharacterized protein n=1 Tax=Ferrovibrio terrae TaxID=2594003 RepID=A0A516GY43_9PROT|nr:hypothetical protein [Ferrovibrio terrae]QDO96417.1 hypothetical protein FNB15_03590 [Ferrovibrio terrae]
MSNLEGAIMARRKQEGSGKSRFRVDVYMPSDRHVAVMHILLVLVRHDFDLQLATPIIQKNFRATEGDSVHIDRLVKLLIDTDSRRYARPEASALQASMHKQLDASDGEELNMLKIEGNNAGRTLVSSIRGIVYAHAVECLLGIAILLSLAFVVLIALKRYSDF